MVNTVLLEKKIDESGYKKKFLASKLGITLQAFINKIQGKNEFLASEIFILSELLKLSEEDRTLIFFTKIVE